MRKIAIICACVASVLLAIFAVCVFIASNIFDSKINSVVNTINHKQRYASFSYLPISNSILSKKGKLVVSVPTKKYGTIQSVFMIDTEFSFTSFKVNLTKKDNEGNLNKFLTQMNIPLFKLQGAFAIYPWQLKGSGAFKTSAFSLPLDDGECRFGENSLYISGRSLDSLTVELASAGVKCKGYAQYNSQDAYNFSFLDLAVKAKPTIDPKNKKFSLDSIDVNFNNLDMDASTIYLIGFEPTDNVKDISLRDRFKVNNFSTTINISQKDKHNRQKISTEGVFNINFAMPYVKENQVQPYYDLSNINYEASLGSVDFENLVRALEKFEQAGMLSIMATISHPLEFNLENFSFTHQNKQFKSNGELSVNLDKSTGKMKNLNGKLAASADRQFIDSLLSKQYEEPFLNLLDNKSINLSRGVYSTVLEVKDKEITLNGKPLSLEDNSKVDQNKSLDISLDDNY